MCKWPPGSKPRRSPQTTVVTQVTQRLQQVNHLAALLADRLGLDISDLPDPELEPSLGSNSLPAVPPPPPPPPPLSAPPAPPPSLPYAASPSLRQGSVDVDSLYQPPGLDFSRVGYVGQAWNEPGVPEPEAVRQMLIRAIPEPSTLEALCRLSLENGQIIRSSVDQRRFWLSWKQHKQLGLFSHPNPSASPPPVGKTREQLIFLALVLVLSAMSFLCAHPHHRALHRLLLQLYGNPISVLADLAMTALVAANALVHPSIESVRVELLLTRLSLRVKEPHLGDSMATVFTARCLNLGLDQDPSPSLSRDEKYDRWRLWAWAYVLESWTVFTTKRGSIIPDRARPSPSFLYSDASWTIVSENDQWPLHLKVRALRNPLVSHQHSEAISAHPHPLFTSLPCSVSIPSLS